MGNPVAGEITGVFEGFNDFLPEETLVGDPFIAGSEITFFDADGSSLGSSLIWSEFDFLISGLLTFDLTTETITSLEVTSGDGAGPGDDLLLTVSSTSSDIYDVSGAGGPVLLYHSDTVLVENCAVAAVPDSGSSFALLLVGLTGVVFAKRGAPRKRAA